MSGTKVEAVDITIDARIPAEASQIICRKFIAIFLTDGLKSCLCPAHAALHPELHHAISDDKKRLCVLCGAGLKAGEGIADL